MYNQVAIDMIERLKAEKTELEIKLKTQVQELLRLGAINTELAIKIEHMKMHLIIIEAKA